MTDASTTILQPCRPYKPGDHSRWLRGRLNRSMLIAAVVGGILAPLPALIVALAARPTGPAATIAGWSGILLFPLLFIVIHWATIGRRRWTAIELVAWVGRIPAARYRAVTGIGDPTDRGRSAAWLASSPHRDGEPAETTYWRAFIHLLLDDLAAARSELSRLSDDAEWERERAELAAQIDIAEGRPADVGRLVDAVQAMAPSEQRAVAALEVAALRSQVAWTCRDDDVAPVLAALPLVEGRARGTLLRHYWVPLGLTVLAVWAVIWLLLSLLG